MAPITEMGKTPKSYIPAPYRSRLVCNLSPVNQVNQSTSQPESLFHYWHGACQGFEVGVDVLVGGEDLVLVHAELRHAPG